MLFLFHAIFADRDPATYAVHVLWLEVLKTHFEWRILDSSVTLVSNYTYPINKHCLSLVNTASHWDQIIEIESRSLIHIIVR